MTYYDAFVTSPSHVAGLGEQSERPDERALTSDLIFLPEGGAALSAIRDAVKGSRVRGIRVDWGSRAALMTGHEIARFPDEIFGPVGEYEASAPQHLADKMCAVRAFVARLSPDKPFAVVVEESRALPSAITLPPSPASAR